MFTYCLEFFLGMAWVSVCALFLGFGPGAFFIFPLAAALRIPKMTLEAAPAVRLGRAIGVFGL
jgi:hypothetical protein